MNRKNLPSLLLFACVALLFSGCERLGNGVVQEIDFPTHTPQLAVTLISRPTTDTLVARAHTSAGILDTTGSKRLKKHFSPSRMKTEQATRGVVRPTG